MRQPEIIIRWNDSNTKACAWLVIDRLINGVCGGGTFMHASATEQEATDLARTMSYKNALQKIPFGGAKAGIRYDHTLPDATLVLERFLQYIKPWLETVWCTGADLNTSNSVMQQIISNMGLPSLFGALGKMVARHAKIEDQSKNIFSRMTMEMSSFFSLSEGATGYSVALVVGIVCQKKNPRVFIQGFGSVGRSLSYFLQEMNLAKVVGISDAEGYLYHEDGIDCMDLLRTFYSSASSENKNMDQWLSPLLKQKYRYKKRKSTGDDYVIESLKDKNIDIFCPCASRYAVTAPVINSIATQYDSLFIIAGANNVFDASGLSKALEKKNIYCFPEWISNCGNALLYEELLSMTELPQDYVTYIKNAIQRGIHSFIADSLPGAYSPGQWHEIFITTAEKRLAPQSKMHDPESLQYAAFEELSISKNLILTV